MAFLISGGYRGKKKWYFRLFLVIVQGVGVGRIIFRVSMADVHEACSILINLKMAECEL